MAKMFQAQEKVPEVKKTLGISLVVGLLVMILISMLIIDVINKGKNREINKSKMELVKLLKMDNSNILTLKVKYETTLKVDPEDTSDVFFEVINGNDIYKEGDLIRFPHRFFNEIEIEGKTYCAIDTQQIQCHLEKKDVKENLLKR